MLAVYEVICISRYLQWGLLLSAEFAINGGQNMVFGLCMRKRNTGT